MVQCVTVCYGALQRVAVLCSVLQCVVVCCSRCSVQCIVLQSLQCALQCVAVVAVCVAVCCGRCSVPSLNKLHGIRVEDSGFSVTL